VNKPYTRKWCFSVG